MKTNLKGEEKSDFLSNYQSHATSDWDGLLSGENNKNVILSESQKKERDNKNMEYQQDIDIE